MWKFLNSRKVAFWLLFLVLALLLASAFIPSGYTLSDGELADIGKNRPQYAWIIAHLSTPVFVKSPLFNVASFLLFASTFACTVDRLRLWIVTRRYDFVKDKAFSFSASGLSPLATDRLQERILQIMAGRRWRMSAEETEGRTLFSAQKGVSGFWGSVVFHLGLILCFLAGPTSALTGFKADLPLLENERVPLSTSLASGGSAPLPGVEVAVRQARGEYFQGRFRYDFGGKISFSEGERRQETPFSVNHPAEYRGYQFSLQEFGFAPRLTVQGGAGNFDTFLRVSLAEEKDYFDLGGGLRALVLFFPDFFREGNRIGTRSRLPNNPVTMVKLYRGNTEVYKGLFKPGESALWEGNRIAVPEYRHWMSFRVTRDLGVEFVMLGSLLVVAGLLVRFLSNERRLELELAPVPEGTRCTIRGYSRYYPAFLENEVLALSKQLGTQG